VEGGGGHGLVCEGDMACVPGVSHPMAQAIFESNLFPYGYSLFLKPSHSAPTCLWRWNRQSVQKHRHIKFRRWEITQKKAYNLEFDILKNELIWLV
jgi:hypothetical protein